MSKLQDFSEMLHIQHLDVPHLRGRETGKDNNCDDEPKQEPVEGKRRVREEDESETVGLGNGNGETKVEEGLRSREADRRGRRVRDRMSRGARAKRQVGRRSRGEGPIE